MNPVPKKQWKYEYLVEMLRNKIQDLPQESRLPSTRAMMRRYNVSKQTVSTALSYLKRESLIVSKHGSGLYVRKKNEAARMVVYHRVHSCVDLIVKMENELELAIVQSGFQFVRYTYPGFKKLDDLVLTFPDAVHLVSNDLLVSGEWEGDCQVLPLKGVKLCWEEINSPGDLVNVREKVENVLACIKDRFSSSVVSEGGVRQGF